MAAMAKVDETLLSLDQVPPSDLEVETCLKAVEKSYAATPALFTETELKRRRAKCDRDGLPLSLKVTTLIDNTKLLMSGPPWSNKKCYDCNGAHKNLPICLDCEGKDIQNPACYQCSTPQDRSKKFCLCKKYPH
jgi:hypothetical protein